MNVISAFLFVVNMLKISNFEGKKYMKITRMYKKSRLPFLKCMKSRSVLNAANFVLQLALFFSKKKSNFCTLFFRKVFQFALFAKTVEKKMQEMLKLFCETKQPFSPDQML